MHLERGLAELDARGCRPLVRAALAERAEAPGADAICEGLLLPLGVGFFTLRASAEVALCGQPCCENVTLPAASTHFVTMLAWAVDVSRSRLMQTRADRMQDSFPGVFGGQP